MKLGLSTRDLRTLLLGGALGLIVLAVYVTMILQPLWRGAASLGQQVRSARQQLGQLQQATANETALREQHRRLQEDVLSLRADLPSQEELSAIIEFLSSLASQTQVKIQTIFPERSLNPLAAAAGGKIPPELIAYKEMSIQIDAQASFHQLGTFLALVEASDKPMQVATLRISGNPKEPRWHNVNLSILGYFAVQEGATANAPTLKLP